MLAGGNGHDVSGSAAVPLLIVGAGGFAREAAEAVRATNTRAARWRLLGHLDDDPTRHGCLVGPSRVLGPAEAVHDYPEAQVLVCTGRPDDYFSRERLVTRLNLDAPRFATVVHPAAVVPDSTVVGEGTVVLAGTVVTVDAVLGRHVAVMPQVVLTHDVVIDDFATLASGVQLGGGARVEQGAYLGAGVLLREGVRIGSRSLIGMGAVVTRNVPDGQVWYGAPARWVRDVKVPPDRPAQPIVAVAGQKERR